MDGERKIAFVKADPLAQWEFTYLDQDLGTTRIEKELVEDNDLIFAMWPGADEVRAKYQQLTEIYIGPSRPPKHSLEMSKWTLTLDKPKTQYNLEYGPGSKRINLRPTNTHTRLESLFQGI